MHCDTVSVSSSRHHVHSAKLGVSSDHLPKGCRKRLDMDSGCGNGSQRESFHATMLCCLGFSMGVHFTSVLESIGLALWASSSMRCRPATTTSARVCALVCNQHRWRLFLGVRYVREVKESIHQVSVVFPAGGDSDVASPETKIGGV